jgi:hypothetical protein
VIQTDTLAKSAVHIEAVLSLIQCGDSMEHDSDHISREECVGVYMQAISLLTSTHTIIERNACGDGRVLQVLSLRLQALLYLRLHKVQESQALHGAVPGGCTAPSSGGSVKVHQELHLDTQRNLLIALHLQLAHALWEAADAIPPIPRPRMCNFFASIDSRCGRISLHSPVAQIVRYCAVSLSRNTS